ncbi:unnamed protein product [Symbiodinium sp. CCMP2592]|nr:unnamed protein product [Symbiodinium sp. CCMP2592]
MSSEEIFQAMCKACPAAAIKQAIEANHGLFWYPEQNVELACSNFAGLLKELFKLGKTLLPKETQKAMERFNTLHCSKLLDDKRTPRNQGQGILNMMSLVNRKRRNLKDGSRMSETMVELIECSRTAPGSCSSASIQEGRRASLSEGRRASLSPSTRTPKHGQTPDDILEAFGLKKVGDSDDDAVVVVEPQALKDEVVDLEKDLVTIKDYTIHTDHALGVLVRLHKDGRVEQADMTSPPEKGFLVGVFGDGERVVSELPSLPPVSGKIPVAIKAKKAKKSKKASKPKQAMKKNSKPKPAKSAKAKDAAIAPKAQGLVPRVMKRMKGKQAEPHVALHRVRVTKAKEPARAYVTACQCGSTPSPSCRQQLIVEFSAKHFPADFHERAIRAQTRIQSEGLSFFAARNLKQQLGQ